MQINSGASVGAEVSAGAAINATVSPSASVDVDVGTQTRVVATDYERLSNKPSIEDVQLVGNKKLTEFGVGPIGNAAILDLFR